MKQEYLAKWLKTIIIGIAVCMAIIYVYIIPFWGEHMIKITVCSEFVYMPWLIFIMITVFPAAAGLVCCWKIAAEIGRDNSFSYVNAQTLKKISFLAAADAAYFFVGNLLFICLDMSHPALFLLSLFVVFAGMAVAVASAALSHLVYKAAVMREENDLTI